MFVETIFPWVVCNKSVSAQEPHPTVKQQDLSLKWLFKIIFLLVCKTSEYEVIIIFVCFKTLTLVSLYSNLSPFKPKCVWGLKGNQKYETESFCFLIVITQDLGSPTIEEQVHQTTIDDETILIVPSPHGFIQTSDVIDTESVLPLTTLTGIVTPSCA